MNARVSLESILKAGGWVVTDALESSKPQSTHLCLAHLDKANPVHEHDLRRPLSGNLGAITLLPRLRCHNGQPRRSASNCERKQDSDTP